MRILDVGCGPGSISIDLARRVGDRGLVVGIDASAEVVETARAAAAQAGVGDIEFRVGDANDPAPGERYDIVHARPRPSIRSRLSSCAGASSSWRCRRPTAATATPGRGDLGRVGCLVARRGRLDGHAARLDPRQGLSAPQSSRRTVVE